MSGEYMGKLVEAVRAALPAGLRLDDALANHVRVVDEHDRGFAAFGLEKQRGFLKVRLSLPGDETPTRLLGWDSEVGGLAAKIVERAVENRLRQEAERKRLLEREVAREQRLARLRTVADQLPLELTAMGTMASEFDLTVYATVGKVVLCERGTQPVVAMNLGGLTPDQAIALLDLLKTMKGGAQ